MSTPRIFECLGEGLIIPLTITMEGCRDERVLREDWFVRWQEYDKLHQENARLKAEVERLTPLLGDIVSFDEYHKLLQQVERLTKAGDAMASSIQFNEEMAKDYNGPTIVHQSVQRWNAAKEGKGQP